MPAAKGYPKVVGQRGSGPEVLTVGVQRDRGRFSGVGAEKVSVTVERDARGQFATQAGQAGTQTKLAELTWDLTGLDAETQELVRNTVEAELRFLSPEALDKLRGVKVVPKAEMWDAGEGDGPHCNYENGYIIINRDRWGSSAGLDTLQTELTKGVEAGWITHRGDLRAVLVHEVGHGLHHHVLEAGEWEGKNPPTPYTDAMYRDPRFYGKFPLKGGLLHIELTHWWSVSGNAWGKDQEAVADAYALMRTRPESEWPPVVTHLNKWLVSKGYLRGQKT